MNGKTFGLAALLLAGCTIGNGIAALGDAAARGWTLQGAVDLAGSQSNYLRAEALNANVLRIWANPTPGFHRSPSNALLDPNEATTKLAVTPRGSSLILKTADLALTVDRKTLGFAVSSADGSHSILDGGDFAFNDHNGWSMTYRLKPDEHLVGMGEDNQSGGSFDRRGTIRDMWTGQQINSGNVTANYPIPLIVSTGYRGHAYGVFIDDIHRMHLDLGATDKNQLRCDAEGGPADIYIINGPTIKDVVERYLNLTGRPPLPPLWVLGYWQSKCVFWNWHDIDDASTQLTQRGFPHDVMVIDYDWPEYLNDYVWDKRWSADGNNPNDKVAAYAKQGVKFVLSNSGPMVVKNSPTFPSGWKAGVFATDGKGNPVEAGYYHGELLDFTSPAMDSWLLPQVAPLIKTGVAGWWLDLSEPEGENDQTVYKGGSSAEIHNQYSLLESRWFDSAQIKVKPQVRPWVLTRCASAGIQRYHVSVWTGDTHSDYPTLQAHPGAMLNSGLSGLTWWTCDSGGFLSGFYKNDQFGAHGLLYDRWMQFAAFSPITRSHHAGPVLPYEFGSQAEQDCRHYIQLRYRLLPYIYSYAWEASQTGLPIARPLLMEYPKDPGSLSAPGDEYLFGRELLVAPVLTEATTTRSVYFPPGKWTDWDYGYDYDGGKTYVVPAPQNRIPVAVRAGAIIPMAPLMDNTQKAPWDPITVEVFPSGTSTFTMYKDDGASFAYRKGAFTLTRFTSVQAARSVNFTVVESNKLYVPHRYVVHFHLRQLPMNVSIDGVAAKPAGSSASMMPMQWAWDSQARVLSVSIGDGAVLKHVVTVRTDPAMLAPRLAPKIEPVAMPSSETALASPPLSPHA